MALIVFKHSFRDTDMRLLIEPESHYNYLDQCVQASPLTVKIATCNLFAGILPDGRDTTEWQGEQYRSRTREFLEAMRPIGGVGTVKILMGLYEYKSCKGKDFDCHSCERKYIKDLIRLINHAEKFPEFKWRIRTHSHAKYSLFTYLDGSVKGVAGGRNLTDSTFVDITVELDKMSVLRLDEHFDELWGSAHLLNSDRIGVIMDEQGISEKAVKLLMSEAV